MIGVHRPKPAVLAELRWESCPACTVRTQSQCGVCGGTGEVRRANPLVGYLFGFKRLLGTL